ncbi:DNA-directed RNA polymerases II, IV and V subunit 9A-like [Phalaenopsis equestris]|uniref:DNA-directed RNA polymerases II, IV and V subunit 9A-like n=1 Tax=Phalaenopsis equestris TaxID=78828 RepID=UPI0009E20978|nr:DNA-directed RNA polymerases II, IV and V subunit 9A-like [Phalaenopsis equestris]
MTTSVNFMHGNACSRNLFLPREDKERKILLNACRLCPYEEVAEMNCTYRNEEFRHPTGEEPPLVLRHAYEDPTLPRAYGLNCPVCDDSYVVYFVAKPTENLVPTFACCNPSCGHNWRNID